VALFVDEVLGEDGVGHCGDVVGVALARVDLDGLEAVAEFTAQGLEALGRDEWVPGEAQPEHAAASARALLHDIELFVTEVDRGAVVLRDAEGQGGLAQNRRHHDFVEHHREREVAGQAHPESADTRAAALQVDLLGERAQEVGDGARCALCQDVELAADAGARHLPGDVASRELLAGRAEQARQNRGEAFVGDPPPEASDLGGDAGDFVHDHDTRSRTTPVDGARGALVAEVRSFEAFQ
jgi:hypothetical protein